MKKTLLLPLVGMLLVLTGCVVTSVYPFYTEKELVFEPALLGAWVDAPTGTNSGSDQTVFEKDGVLQYKLSDGKGGESYEAHLFKLKDQLFLDVISSNCKGAIPAHSLMKVTLTESTLRISLLNYDWVKKLVEKSPKVIRHHKVYKNAETTDYDFVLTADTMELQKFVLKQLKNEQAFGEPKDMVHPKK
jgi:hypothetical protein